MTKTSWLPIRLLAVVVGLASFNSFSNPTEVGLDSIAAKILQYSQKADDAKAVLTNTGAADLNVISGKRAGDITLFNANSTKD